MSSKNKILALVLIITVGFLARDTVRIEGPIDMSPTFTILIVSFVLSFLLISLSENKKTQNHNKVVLGFVSLTVSLLSIIGAYVFDISNYRKVAFLDAIQNNLLSAINNILDFGFLIIVVAVIFGFIVGSDKVLRTTYSFKSSKHTVPENNYKKFSKK